MTQKKVGAHHMSFYLHEKNVLFHSVPSLDGIVLSVILKFQFSCLTHQEKTDIFLNLPAFIAFLFVSQHLPVLKAFAVPWDKSLFPICVLQGISIAWRIIYFQWTGSPLGWVKFPNFFTAIPKNFLYGPASPLSTKLLKLWIRKHLGHSLEVLGWP